METYRVSIDSKSYFEVESYLIKVGENDVRVVNLRSVHGHIGIDFNFLSDEKLKELVKTYQRTTDNVELLNVLSRQYNGWSWFEAYDESYNVNREPTKEELMDPSRTLNNDEGKIFPSSQIVDVRRFIPEVRATRGLLSPDALKEYLHKGIRVEVPIDLSKIKYVPIWHINGPLRTKAELVELYCPFEVLVHILAKRFIDFKAKLLTLISTDIQLAVAQGEKLNDYTSFRKRQLVEACQAKDDKIDKLTGIVVDQGKQINNLVKNVEELTAVNRDQTNQITELKAINLDQTQTIDELYNMTFNAKASIEDMREMLQDKDKSIEAISKAANHVIHEVGKLAVKDRKMNKSNDILVLYLSEMKPVPDHARADKRDDQLWIASYNGKDINFKPPNIPDDHEDLFTIDSNRLDSFEYMIETEAVRPYIRKVYQRSILIDENDLDNFIDACDSVLNENNTIKSVRTLDSVKQRIAARKNEEKKTNSIRLLKRKLLTAYPRL